MSFLDRFKKKPSIKEKGDWNFKCDKGEYQIHYTLTTEKNNLFKAYKMVKPFLPEQAKGGNKSVLDSGEEIIIDKKALPKVEKALVIQLNPQKYVFPEIKKDLPDFVHYNIKLAFVSIKKVEENLFLMKLRLEGLCGGDA